MRVYQFRHSDMGQELYRGQFKSLRGDSDRDS